MNLKLTFFTHLLIGISVSTIKVNALKCYVCGDEGELPCNNDFELKKDTFAKECKFPNDKSCEKKTEGDTVIRRCSDTRVDDCQKANGVEYCYCFNDLCNSNIRLVGPPDDEDTIEGSASGTTAVSTGTQKPVVSKDKSSGSKAYLYFSLIFMSFATMFCNK